ncbi:MAG: hypothetical protein AAF724_17165 [Pseudomonadota bacterium]
MEATDTAETPKRGDILSHNDVVDLPPDYQLVVIHRDGTLLRMAGPYSGPLRDYRVLPQVNDNAGDTSVLGVVSDLLKKNDGLISTLGSTREPQTGDVQDKDTNPWQPVVGFSSTYCIDPDRPIIRRVNRSRSVRVKLVSPDFQITETEWPQGTATVHLDQIIDLHHASYDLLISDRPGRSTLVVRPKNLSGKNLEQIVWMAKNGCDQQALQFVNSMLRDK